MKSKFFDSGLLILIILVIAFLCGYISIFDSKDDEVEDQVESNYEYETEYSNPYSSSYVDHDCSDFDTQKNAQLFFEANGGPYDDPHDLDRDGDGMACDWNP
ncbi:hypothetical protein [Lysinibacillus sp. BSL11]